MKTNSQVIVEGAVLDADRVHGEVAAQTQQLVLASGHVLAGPSGVRYLAICLSAHVAPIIVAIQHEVDVRFAHVFGVEHRVRGDQDGEHEQVEEEPVLWLPLDRKWQRVRSTSTRFVEIVGIERFEDEADLR